MQRRHHWRRENNASFYIGLTATVGGLNAAQIREIIHLFYRISVHHDVWRVTLCTRTDVLEFGLWSLNYWLKIQHILKQFTEITSPTFNKITGCTMPTAVKIDKITTITWTERWKAAVIWTLRQVPLCSVMLMLQQTAPLHKQIDSSSTAVLPRLTDKAQLSQETECCSNKSQTPFVRLVVHLPYSKSTTNVWLTICCKFAVIKTSFFAQIWITNLYRVNSPEKLQHFDSYTYGPNRQNLSHVVHSHLC